jgi:hypothetical protein
MFVEDAMNCAPQAADARRMMRTRRMRRYDPKVIANKIIDLTRIERADPTRRRSADQSGRP